VGDQGQRDFSSAEVLAQVDGLVGVEDDRARAVVAVHLEHDRLHLSEAHRPGPGARPDLLAVDHHPAVGLPVSGREDTAVVGQPHVQTGHIADAFAWFQHVVVADAGGHVLPGGQPVLPAHLTSDPDQLLAGTDADRPVVAVRVRASVGRPGGSARARWRQLRAAEWVVWTRSLPWRVAVILGIGAGGGLLGSLLAPRLGLIVAAPAVGVALWGLRFRPSPDAVAWRRGSAGERRTAQLLGPLEQHGWAVLHDLAVPGSWANIDHLVIGPGGVFVIDSKQHRGRLGARVPWGKVVTQGVPVVAARRLPSMLCQLPAVLGPERVVALADQARVRFHAAA
jgi:hypothetical protein